MTPSPEQRAAWVAQAEAALGPPAPGWLDDVQRTKPHVLRCTGAQFFALCRLAKAGRLTIYGMKHDRTLSLGWPSGEVQQELI